MNTKDPLLTTLSNKILDNTVGLSFELTQSFTGKNNDAASNFFNKQLRPKDRHEIPKNMKWPFMLSKTFLGIKKKNENKTKGNKKTNRLSSTQKKALGLNKISKKGLNYNDFKVINQCWLEYICEFLRVPDLEDRGLNGEDHTAWDEFSTNLWKADMHGASVKVVRSKCPVYIGIEGFIVFETKNTYKILSKDNITRCIPKMSCEFSMNIKNYEIKFLGKNMMLKPNERSNKKVKNFSLGGL